MSHQEARLSAKSATLSDRIELHEALTEVFADASDIPRRVRARAEQVSKERISAVMKGKKRSENPSKVDRQKRANSLYFQASFSSARTLA